MDEDKDMQEIRPPRELPHGGLPPMPAPPPPPPSDIPQPPLPPAPDQVIIKRGYDPKGNAQV